MMNKRWVVNGGNSEEVEMGSRAKVMGLPIGKRRFTVSIFKIRKQEAGKGHILVNR